MVKTGLVHVYYGDGQGKTCSAVGLAARACGAGCKVLFAQFLKNGCSAELKALGRLVGSVELLDCKPCHKFVFQMDETEKALVAKEQREAFSCMKAKVSSGAYSMLVMDEAIDLVHLQLITGEELLDFLRNKPENLEVVLTGHKIFPGLLELADYVSEVKKVKHPYDKGIHARRGVDM